MTRTLGASAMDGVHVCQHGDNKGSSQHRIWVPWDDYSDIFGRWIWLRKWHIGVDIYGGVLTAQPRALWINGGGDVNFTNNVVINRAILPGFDSMTTDHFGGRSRCGLQWDYKLRPSRELFLPQHLSDGSDWATSASVRWELVRR